MHLPVEPVGQPGLPAGGGEGVGSGVASFVDVRFRPIERLRKRREFLRVQEKGRKQAGPRLVIIAAPGPCTWTRLGVTVSKKVGNSPERNQVKRWLREAFRLHKQQLPPGLDLVIVARRAALDAGYHALVEDLLRWARNYRPPGRKKGEGGEFPASERSSQ